MFLTNSKNEFYLISRDIINRSAWVTVEIDFIDYIGKSWKYFPNIRHGHFSLLAA